MPYAIWTAVLVTGMACGAAFVGLLVGRRGVEPLMALLTLVFMAGNTMAVLRTAAYYELSEIALLAGFVSLAAAGGGWGLASSLLAPLLESREATPELQQATDERDPGPVALLLACLEPEKYSPGRVAAELAQLSTAGLREPGLIITPFLYMAQKARYRAMGGYSQEASSARRLARRLDHMVAEAYPGAQVELVDCSSPHTLASSVRTLATLGHRRFVVANAAVAESYELDRSTAALNSLHPASLGILVDFTPPLWGSERLAEKIVDRIVAVTVDPARTGVALVMHGQPESRQQTNPDFDEQEAAFCSRIRLLLQEQGMDAHNVRSCYHDWETPDATETVRHLAAMGCTRVVVTPATFPFESATTVLDLPVAVVQARVDEHVSTVVLPAWNEEVVLAEVLLEGISSSLGPPQRD